MLTPTKGRYVAVLTLLLGLFSTVIGGWALFAPRSFARFVNFPAHDHFLHDVGAFQIGIGATLLLALIWRDPLATVLAAFLLGNTIHAINHAADTDLGGHTWDSGALGAVSVAVTVGLVMRLR